MNELRKDLNDRGGRRTAFLLLCAFLLCYGGGLSAQQNRDFEPYCFAGAGLGPRVYFGDHNRQMDVGDRFSFGGDLFAGRQWSPVIGARLGYSLQSISGVTQNGSFSTGTVYDASQWLDKQEYNVGHLYADLLVDAVTLLWGYEPQRFYTLIPFTGVGWAHTMTAPTSSGKPLHSASLSIGLLNKFRLNETLDLTLDARGALVSDKFDNEPGNRKGEGILSINVGIVYKLKVKR